MKHTIGFKKKYQSSFDDFCKYVLPYRNGSEPLEFEKRRQLYEEYSWVYDSIKVKPLENIISTIYENLAFNGAHLQMKHFNGSLSLSQLEKTHFGRCDDMVNYFVGLFRSLGFAAGSDYITHWGNFAHSVGHSWFFLKIKNEVLPIQVGTRDYSESKSKKNFAVGSMPKIYRNNFIKTNHENLKLYINQDVTSDYRLTSTIKIENVFEPNSNKNFKLCVYDNTNQWAIVDTNYVKTNNIISFENVARGILYAVAIEDQGTLKLINHPFYLNF